MFFKGYAVSIRGASHEAANEPCQDSAKTHITRNIAIAALSDGHGSEKHFRSHIGSEAATRIAIRSILDFTERNGGLDNIFRSDPHNAARRIAANIICGWNEEIYAHAKQVPFSEGEQQILAKHPDVPLESIYGATLILAATSGRGLFGLQIGDGSFLATRRGKIYSLMPEDERLVGNLTTSLCDNDAINSFRWFYEPGSFSSITLSSDGLINSFKTRADFLSFSERIPKAIGAKKTQELEAHLKERSCGGSRDDISIAALKNNFFYNY